MWENFGKDLVLEAFDCLYDDYFLLSHVTHETLLITYGETKLYMTDKIQQVLKVLNIQINENSSNMEKFFINFKVIFQDHFSSVFEFTDEINNSIKKKILSEIKSSESLSNEKYNDLESDMNKKSFKNLTQSLFKMCIYMILHDPVLTFNISSIKERQITYLYYNKNDLMNIEGFGTEQTPCAVIVPPPILRKNFAYMGIKPAVYCIQKSQVDEKISLECDKNKSRHQRSSSTKELSTITSNNEKNNSSPKKLVSFKSAVNIDSKYIASNTTPLKKEITNLNNNLKNNNHTIDNYQSNTDKKKDILLNISKSKRVNSGEFKEDFKEITITNATIFTQDHDEKMDNGNLINLIK
jgi:hypothetical protein